MGDYLGWIIAAFLAGILSAMLLRRRRPSLRRQISQMGVFAGRSYGDILRALNAPQTESRQANGQTLRTWRNRDYSISLLFDGRDVCLGVYDEE